MTPLLLNCTCHSHIKYVCVLHVGRDEQNYSLYFYYLFPVDIRATPRYFDILSSKDLYAFDFLCKDPARSECTTCFITLRGTWLPVQTANAGVLRSSLFIKELSYTEAGYFEGCCLNILGLWYREISWCPLLWGMWALAIEARRRELPRTDDRYKWWCVLESGGIWVHSCLGGGSLNTPTVA